MKTKKSVLSGGQSGFTMIEIIAVLTILGLLTVTVLSRYDRETELIVATDLVKAHIRYAQNQAMNRDQNWWVTITSTTYTLNNLSGSALFPGEGAATVTLPSDVSFTVGPATVCFDKWGSPYDAVTVDDVCSGGTKAITLELSLAAKTRNISIEKETGFIP